MTGDVHIVILTLESHAVISQHKFGRELEHPLGIADMSVEHTYLIDTCGEIGRIVEVAFRCLAVVLDAVQGRLIPERHTHLGYESLLTQRTIHEASETAHTYLALLIGRL